MTVKALCKCFDELIHPDWKLPQSGGTWQLREPGAGHSQLDISGGKSLAFTLDRSGHSAFPFFSSTLPGVNKVTDALVIAEVDGRAYATAIEMKTSSGAINDALKQIESGRLLVEWATSLLRAHGHWNGGACTFFGIVSLKPRRQPRKGTTSRSAELPDPEISRHGGGYPFFTLANHPRAPVVALVRKLESHARNTQGDGR